MVLGPLAGKATPPESPVKRSAIPSPSTYDPVSVKALPRESAAAGITGRKASAENPQPVALMLLTGESAYSGRTKRRSVPEAPIERESIEVEVLPPVRSPFQGLTNRRSPACPSGREESRCGEREAATASSRLIGALLKVFESRICGERE